MIKYQKNILCTSIDEKLDNRFYHLLTKEYNAAKKYHLTKTALAKLLVLMVKAYSEARDYLVAVDSLAAALTIELLNVSREDLKTQKRK